MHARRGGWRRCYGGAVATSTSPLVVSNSTISGNSAGGGGSEGHGYGGGISAGAGLTLSSSTVTENSALFISKQGGGGGVEGALTAENSIVADNSSETGPNCLKAATSKGNNIENGSSCGFGAAGDQTAEPLLGPLQDNGGPGPTHALLAGSPALDHGAACPATDERGVVRPQGAACDVGAYELAPPAVLTGSASGISRSAATLNGTATNPDAVAGTVYFQWGTSTSYGSQTPAQALGAGASGAAAAAEAAGIRQTR